MMQDNNIESFCPASSNEWRQWLSKNHISKQSVWLICYKKKSGKPSVSWSEAVDEALCFGWVDSRRKPIDDEKFMQFFCKRKPNSTWSKINKDKIEFLKQQGLMVQAGHDVIKLAIQNGSWTILDAVEAFLIPEELEQAFSHHPGSKDFFISLSKSARKSILQWLVLAKRPETRQKRINEVAELAGKGQKPKLSA